MRLHKLIRVLKVAVGVAMITAFMTACGEDVQENNNYMDLNTYFGKCEIEGYDSCTVIVDEYIQSQGIITEDEDIYIPYDTVRKKINKRFYVDKTENVLSYVTDKTITDSEIGTKKYNDGNEKEFDKITSIKVGDTVYVSIDYCVSMCNNIEFAIASNPDRLIIKTALNNSVATTNEACKMRYEASDMSDILVDVEANKKVYVLESAGEFVKVADETGIVGYIKNSSIGEQVEEMTDISYESVVYDHILRDHKICLGWHQVGRTEDNASLNDLVSTTKGLNVVSPTWYMLNDKEGSFISYASKEYVELAHSMKMEVWALFSDFMLDEETQKYFVNEVLSKTSSRRHLIKNIVNEVKNTGIDGVNIDFEKIDANCGEDFVQFIRELSIECKKLNVVLSADMYVPIASNLYYDRTSVGEACDYLMVMGYDEHWGGCKEAGSVASIGFVTSGITETLKEIEPSRLINAIPFYTRVWIETPEELAEEGDEIIEDSVFGNHTIDSFAVGMGTAKRYLDENNASLLWLEDCGQYYGEYEKDGSTYRIWLEDQESTKKKLEVMEQYQLGGVACWKLGLEINDIWNIICEYVNN